LVRRTCEIRGNGKCKEKEREIKGEKGAEGGGGGDEFTNLRTEIGK